jgi:hypothetical protein
MEGLQVHHIQPRSRLGDDTAENLDALCVMPHQIAHRQRQATQRDLLMPARAEAVIFQQGQLPAQEGQRLEHGFDSSVFGPAKTDFKSSYVQVEDMSSSYPLDQ